MAENGRRAQEYQTIGDNKYTKTAIFLCYGAVFSLLPFLPGHVRGLGLSWEQSAAGCGVVLLASFFAPPLTGYLTEKYGRTKLILLVLLLSTGLLHNLLLVVPTATSVKPMGAHMMCTDSGGYLFVETCPAKEPKCTFDSNDTASSYASIVECQHQCLNQSEYATHPDPSVCFSPDKKAPCHPFSAEAFPTSNFSLQTLSRLYFSRTECVYRIKSILWGNDTLTDMRCPSLYSECRVNCSMAFTKVNGSRLMCDAAADTSHTLYSYCVLRFLCVVTLASALALLESIILAKAAECKADYGKQRVWAFVVATVVTPVAGCFIDGAQADGDQSASTFYPAFVQFDVFLVLAVVVIFVWLAIPTLPPSSKVGPSHLLVNGGAETLLFFGVVLCLGVFWGFLDFFLFGVLKTLDTTWSINSALGVARMAGTIFCIPSMYFADSAMNKVGRVSFLMSAFVIYALQLLGYAYVDNAWGAVGLELLNSITNCLKLASFVTLAGILAPKSLQATMQGTVFSLHYLVGGGVGVLLGGYMMELFKRQATFRALGICSFVIGVLYAIVYFIFKCKKLTHTAVPNGPLDEPQLEPVKSPETGV